MIEVNQIIKNLIPTEPVTIIKLQPLGNMYSTSNPQLSSSASFLRLNVLSSLN